MARHSMPYIKANDLFEEARERYEQTSPRWRNKWWEVICDIWERCAEWHNKYELDKITKKVIERVKQVIDGIIEKVPINYAKGTKLCYLFKFYDANGVLLFSKVGTTERGILVRIKEEMRKYKKSGFNVKGVAIESVIDCGEIPPEGPESAARSYFIAKNPKSFTKNDRFSRFDISVNEFNNCVNNYLQNQCAGG